MGAVHSGMEWWRGCAIYQIYPRSFQDTTGNGIGDLEGVRRRLAHIASLGVEGVWLSPFFKSPMADMGYDVSDYCDVDPLFGTIEDFDAVLSEAQRLGLKVIIDQVLSHTSDRHAWFAESRSSRDNAKADWYVWADGKPDGTAPNNWLSVFGGSAWEWDTTRRQFFMHNFLASQPDLNFHNPEVQDAILETVRFWLERGVDGFRLDTVNFYFHDPLLRDNPPLPPGMRDHEPEANPYGLQHHLFDKSQPENVDFLKRLRALTDCYPDRVTVGEVSDGARSMQTVGRYTQGGDKLDMCYTFDLLRAPFSAPRIRGSIAEIEAHIGDGWICWALSNHDVERHVSRWAGPGRDTDGLARLAMALLCSLRGTICLYQGEELGLEEAEIAFEELQDPYGLRFWPDFKGRDGCRTPMVWDANETNGGFSTSTPWLPIPKTHLAHAVSRQESDAGSVLNFYRRMLALRRDSPTLREGGITLLDGPDEVVTFLRDGGSERLFCAFNLSDGESSLAIPALLAEEAPLAGEGAEIADGRTVRLAAMGWLIARLA